jgi:hypothetical protein
MPSFNYLIGGGGMTADSAARGIRDFDQERSIGLVEQTSGIGDDQQGSDVGALRERPRCV